MRNGSGCSVRRTEKATAEDEQIAVSHWRSDRFIVCDRPACNVIAWMGLFYVR